MNELELLRDFLNNNLDSIQNGSRDNAISLLKTFCKENNVLTRDEAFNAHYFFEGEAENPEDIREQAVNWIEQAHCSDNGKGHSFQTVYVAPTLKNDGFKINVCIQGGDAFYYEETPAYGEDYSGQIDTGFYCSQLILGTDSDFSCFLSDDEELVIDESLDAPQEETIIETNVPDPVVRESKNIVPGIAVGVLAAILIGLVVYFLKSRK